MTTPFLTIDRKDWAPLHQPDDIPLSKSEITDLQGLNSALDLAEVEQVYRPLTKLVELRIEAAGRLRAEQAHFLGHGSEKVPFIIGLAGSVAVGKSTTARVLCALLDRHPARSASIVTTDGFLLPNAELSKRGLLRRKGFPESYDQRALLSFVHALKSGAPTVSHPVYSHAAYDVLPEPKTLVSPDVIIVEGLNVLQTGTRKTPFVSDYFDFSIYVDAPIEHLKSWYIERFLTLRDTAFKDPNAYFHRYAGLTQQEAVKTATGFWTDINERNLHENILPTRGRADLILEKDRSHQIHRVHLRKA